MNLRHNIPHLQGDKPITQVNNIPRLKDIVNQVLSLLKEMKSSSEEVNRISQAAKTMLTLLDKPSSDLAAWRHDLRNPISAIKGYSELLMEDIPETEIVQLQKIHSLANDMLKLIEGLREEAPPKVRKKNLVLPSTTKGGSVLIVDDVESNRDLLEKWLKKKNYTTYLAKNGPEALALLSQVPCDIVLLDIMMPDMNGFEVLQAIKNKESLVNLIVIMISAVDEMDSIVRCIKLGAMDYLIKPFDPYLLEARIISCLKNKQLLAMYQERVVTRQKLAALGSVTSGIAHEIKNPLNFVSSFSKVSLSIVENIKQITKRVKFTQKDKKAINEDMETLKHNLEKIIKQGSRADKIIQRMISLSSPFLEQKLSPTNIHQMLLLAYETVSEAFLSPGFHVELETLFDPHLESYEGMQEKLFFVFMNLFNNAFYALKTVSQPKITVTTKKIEDKIQIQVANNGPKIPLADQARVFTPFFTTKPPGEGVGLGLALSHNIITQLHKGSITFESNENNTTFTIVLTSL